MAAFQFRDYSLKFEFPGCEFTILGNSDLGDTIKGMREAFNKLHEDYKAGKKTKQEAIDYVLNCINQILGEGATAKIFAERAITLSDVADVLHFIIREVNSHNQRMTQQPMNRAQRRAVMKG